MSEQQRIFVAVALCIGIIVLWQTLTPDPPPPPPAEEPAATTPAATPEQPPVAPDATAGAEPVATEEAATDTAAAPSPRVVEESSRPFETEFFSGEISNKKASLTRFDLKGYNERVREDEDDNGDPEEVHPVTLASAQFEGVTRQAQIDWDLGAFEPPELDWSENAPQDGFLLEGRSDQGVETRVQVTPRTDAYAIDYVLSLRNGASKGFPVKTKLTIAIDPGERESSSWFAPATNQVNGLCAMGDDIERRLDNDVAEDGAWTAPSPVSWAGIDRQYFVVAAVPEGAEGAAFAGCRMSAEGTRLAVEVTLADHSVGPGGSWERRFTVFLGPKRDDALVAVAPALQEVIDYSILGIPLGFLARPMVFLLAVFHGWTTSWGLAIMLLTLVVKVILFPITFKSSVSMRKMQLLRPELERIKKQFADDRERQQTEQMKLFKEKGVNPLGGCLPMLLQMPVWFALYRTLWSAVDLYQQSFLWLPDLTAKEPLPFMAFALGGLTFLQQKLMPTATDSQQAKMMMYFMPVMLTVFMIALPSGLVLYILFNSVLTILQQLVINKRTTSLQ